MINAIIEVVFYIIPLEIAPETAFSIPEPVNVGGYGANITIWILRKTPTTIIINEVVSLWNWTITKCYNAETCNWEPKAKETSWSGHFGDQFPAGFPACIPTSYHGYQDSDSVIFQLTPVTSVAISPQLPWDIGDTGDRNAVEQTQSLWYGRPLTAPQTLPYTLPKINKGLAPKFSGGLGDYMV